MVRWAAGALTLQENDSGRYHLPSDACHQPGPSETSLTTPILNRLDTPKAIASVSTLPVQRTSAPGAAGMPSWRATLLRG